MAENLTAADVGALVNNRNNGWDNDWWIMILFFFIFGNNGWGRNGNGLTQAELQQGFDTQSLLRGQEGIKNGLCDGFYAMNTTMLQSANQTQRDLCQGFSALGSAVSENRFAAQQCCCETNRNIDAVRYENAKNTCDITTNATFNTQRILDKLCNMEMNAKDQRIADLTSNLQTAQFALSQQAQSANIISTLQPTPRPAYITCSPYQAQMFGFSGLNSFNGCGCGC